MTLDLEHPPLKMCRFMRYTCMPNIKFLSSIMQKLWPTLKFFSDGRTDWHTHILTYTHTDIHTYWLTDSSTAICHLTGGIKRNMSRGNHLKSLTFTTQMCPLTCVVAYNIKLNSRQFILDSSFKASFPPLTFNIFIARFKFKRSLFQLIRSRWAAKSIKTDQTASYFQAVMVLWWLHIDIFTLHLNRTGLILNNLYK